MECIYFLVSNIYLFSCIAGVPAYAIVLPIVIILSLVAGIIAFIFGKYTSEINIKSSEICLKLS